MIFPRLERGLTTQAFFFVGMFWDVCIIGCQKMYGVLKVGVCVVFDVFCCGFVWVNKRGEG